MMKRIFFGAAFSLLSIFLVGCGGDVNSESASSTNAETKSPEKNQTAWNSKTAQPAEKKAPSAPDTYPLYPGCTETDYNARKACAQQKLINDLIKTIKYPAKAKDDKVNGTVLHSFIIQADGTMTNLELVNSLTPETDAAAYNAIVDLMELSGPWEPGTLNGQKVAVQYSLPIEFKN